jgi:hypothetical protein
MRRKTRVGTSKNVIEMDMRWKKTLLPLVGSQHERCYQKMKKYWRWSSNVKRMRHACGSDDMMMIAVTKR